MQRPIKVLIVDDDAASLVLLEYLVETLGFQAILATDLASARKLLLTSQPEIVILDLSLPDGDGLDLVDDVRRIVPTADISILTAKMSRIFKSYGWMGVDNTFSKPLDPTVIGAWLDEKRARIDEYEMAGESFR